MRLAVEPKRFCLHCGREMVRPKGTSTKKWGARRVCSAACRAARQRAQRFRWNRRNPLDNNDPDINAQRVDDL